MRDPIRWFKCKLKPPKKGEAVYRRNGPVLCLRWCEKKRMVTMMSTVHPAVYVEVKKKYSDEKIMKPLAVYDYTQRMAGWINTINLTLITIHPEEV